MEKKMLLKRAVLIGDWLVKNQEKNPFDANFGRSINIYDARTGFTYQTVNWTTGLMAAAFCALYKRTGDGKYLEAAKRAGKYVMSLQVMDQRRPEFFGLFRELTPQSVECCPRDATSAAWGLVWLYTTTGDREYLERAVLFAEWHMQYGMVNGWPRYLLNMRPGLQDCYAQGAFQSGTGLFYHDLFVATGDARFVERGMMPIAVNYRDRFFREDGSIVLEREAFTGKERVMSAEERMHAYNDDFGAAMLQTAADFFKDESFREKALSYSRWLLKNQDADGGFAHGESPSGIPTALMYFHDLGTYYNDRKLLGAREKTLKKLYELQHQGTGDAKLDGGIQGANDIKVKWRQIPGAPAKHVNIRCSLYSIMAFLKLESDLAGIWLGRHNEKWADPILDYQWKEAMDKLGYLSWFEADSKPE